MGEVAKHRWKWCGVPWLVCLWIDEPNSAFEELKLCIVADEVMEISSVGSGGDEHYHFNPVMIGLLPYLLGPSCEIGEWRIDEADLILGPVYFQAINRAVPIRGAWVEERAVSLFQGVQYVWWGHP